MSTLISETNTPPSDVKPSAGATVRATTERFSPSEDPNEPALRDHVAAIEADLSAATRARDSARTLRDKVTVPARTA